MGKKGEIYTSKEIRKKMGLKTQQRTKSYSERRWKEAVIQTIPSIEDILRRKPLIKITSEDAEKISEQEQKRMGIYGS